MDAESDETDAPLAPAPDADYIIRKRAMRIGFTTFAGLAISAGLRSRGDRQVFWLLESILAPPAILFGLAAWSGLPRPTPGDPELSGRDMQVYSCKFFAAVAGSMGVCAISASAGHPTLVAILAIVLLAPAMICVAVGLRLQAGRRRMIEDRLFRGTPAVHREVDAWTT